MAISKDDKALVDGILANMKNGFQEIDSFDKGMNDIDSELSNRMSILNKDNKSYEKDFSKMLGKMKKLISEFNETHTDLIEDIKKQIGVSSKSENYGVRDISANTDMWAGTTYSFYFCNNSYNDFIRSNDYVNLKNKRRDLRSEQEQKIFVLSKDFWSHFMLDGTKLTKGDRVYCITPKLKSGVITDVNDTTVNICFDDGGSKRFPNYKKIFIKCDIADMSVDPKIKSFDSMAYFLS